MFDSYSLKYAIHSKVHNPTPTHLKKKDQEHGKMFSKIANDD